MIGRALGTAFVVGADGVPRSGGGAERNDDACRPVGRGVQPTEQQAATRDVEPEPADQIAATGH
jgi:hypothetical protein